MCIISIKLCLLIKTLMAFNKIDDFKLHKTISNDRSISLEKERQSNYQSHLNTNNLVMKRKTHNISISSSPHKHSTRSTSIKKKDISSVSNMQLNDNSSMQRLRANYKELFNYKIEQSYLSHYSKKNSIQKTFLSHHKGESSQSSIKVNSSQKEASAKSKKNNEPNIISVQKTITKNASNDYILSSPSEKKITHDYKTNKYSNSNNYYCNNIKIKNSKYTSSTISSIQTDRPVISNSNKRAFSLKEQYLSGRKRQHYSMISSSKSPHHQSNSSFTQIKICLLSNWGNSELIGLKEIFLEDSNKKRIQVIKCKVINGNQSNIYNLFNVNPSYSSKRKNAMWISPFKPSNEAKGLILEVYFISTNNLKSITLANYCGKDKSIGVKDITIVNDKSIVVVRMQIPQAKDNNDKSIQIDLGSENKERADIEQYSIKKIVVNRKPYHKMNDQMSPGSCLIKSAANFTIVNIKTFEDFPINEIGEKSKENDKAKTGQNSTSLVIKSKTITSITPLKYLDDNSNIDIEEKAIECRKIRILLLSNHGHHKHIGLTNLMFVNDKNEQIDIHSQAKELIAIPKDISTYMNMKTDKRKFDNIFNNIYQTIEDRYMWLTKLNNDSNSSNNNDNNSSNSTYIDIVFKDQIKLSKVVFANFNDPKHLDKGVKKAILKFFTNLNDCQPISEYLFYLHKGIGYEHIEYTQELFYPFREHILSEEELMPFYQIEYADNIPGYQYYTPYLPSGFVLMFQLFNNYGHDSLIGVEAIELYDQLGRDILKQTKHSVGFYPSREISHKQMVLKYINVKLKDDDNYASSVITYVFNTPISLSYIKIFNGFTEDNDQSIGVKELKVFIDDFIIFEGLIPSNKDKSSTKEKMVAFTSNSEILNYINNHQ